MIYHHFSTEIGTLF